MSPIQRAFRRIPFIRYCAMQYAREVRRKQAKASWAHIQSTLSILGNITISWAGIELMLSHLVIWHHVKNGIRPEKGLPRMLAYQLDYVKDTIEKDWKIPPADRARIATIRKKIAELNEFRINVTHGVVHQRNRYTMDWHTHSIKIDGLKWREIRKTFTHAEMLAKSTEIADLGSEISPFFARVIEMPHPDNPTHSERMRLDSSGNVIWRP